jgi:hypothetical protein
MLKKQRNYLPNDRETCGKLFRWISGHSFHRYHNFLIDPENTGTSLCRACKEEREETSHLYAFCGGLVHLRMKILGQLTLGTQFEWQPHQLITMINYIDKLYPEINIPGHIPIYNNQGHDSLEDIGLRRNNSSQSNQDRVG